MTKQCEAGSIDDTGGFRSEFGGSRRVEDIHIAPDGKTAPIRAVKECEAVLTAPRGDRYFESWEHLIFKITN